MTSGTRELVRVGAIVALLLLATEARAQSFPPDPQWVPFACNRSPMNDPFNDQPGFTAARDVVGSFDAPAGMRVRDANFLYLRLRLDQDPATAQGAWGYELDLDNNPATYEVLVIVDGTMMGQRDVLVRRNTMTTTPNAPADPAEMQVMSLNALHTQTRMAAGSAFGGGTDHWIEMAVPWSVVMPLGLTPTSPLRVWAGSSSMNDRLDGDLACHDGGTGAPTLDGIASDPTVFDPLADSDGDGFTDAEEIAAGTDPNDPNSRPESSRLEGGGGCSTGGGGCGWLAVIAVLLAAGRRGRGSTRRRRRR